MIHPSLDNVIFEPCKMKGLFSKISKSLHYKGEYTLQTMSKLKRIKILNFEQEYAFQAYDMLQIEISVKNYILFNFQNAFR